MARSHTKPNGAIQRTSKLRAWLDSVRAQNKQGLLRAADVVKAAVSSDSPGHKYFTWDNATAGAKYRVIEAEKLIRRVYVIDADNGAKAPAFVSLLPDRELPGGGYRATADVVSSKALRAQLELTAKAELRAWTERYQMLSGLTGKVAKAAGLSVAKAKASTT